MYDVLIVGAGPIGSYCGYLLAKKGVKAAILEEHSSVGEDVNCSGIISTETFDRFNLPLDSIISRMYSVKLISPSGKSSRYSPDECLAYIVDRERFDPNIADMAKREGVEFIFNSKVYDINYENDSMSFVSNKYVDVRVDSARIGIISTGYGTALTKKMGCGDFPETFFAAQTEVEMAGIEETEIYVGNEVAPGSFAWAVPSGTSHAKVGLSV